MVKSKFSADLSPVPYGEASGFTKGFQTIRPLLLKAKIFNMETPMSENDSRTTSYKGAASLHKASSNLGQNVGSDKQTIISSRYLA